MGGGLSNKNEERLNILVDIREMESPGRRGCVSPYAQVIYGYYTEIQELLDDGFTMATVCSYFEKKGVLPDNADKHSFRRALRRETARRKKARKPKNLGNKNASEQKEIATTLTKEPEAFTPRVTSDLRELQRVQGKSAKGLEVNPDNTFAIRPIDPDDLPDFDKLT